MAEHKVQDGDCILSICANAGLPIDTVWNHSANSDLKSKRKHPTILKPGDRVFLPERAARQESGSTENKHKFKRPNTKAKLNLRLLNHDKPLANVKCVLVIDGELHELKTDRDGRLDVQIKATAAEGTLQIEGDGHERVLKLGWLDPIDSTSGVQARLNNLGFNCGKVDDDMGKNTRRGMHEYQNRETLKETRNPDDETRSNLEKDYGC